MPLPTQPGSTGGTMQLNYWVQGASVSERLSQPSDSTEGDSNSGAKTVYEDSSNTRR